MMVAEMGDGGLGRLCGGIRPMGLVLPVRVGLLPIASEFPTLFSTRQADTLTLQCIVLLGIATPFGVALPWTPRRGQDRRTQLALAAGISIRPPLGSSRLEP